jgi:hypothetical protein
MCTSTTTITASGDCQLLGVPLALRVRLALALRLPVTVAEPHWQAAMCTTGSTSIVVTSTTASAIMITASGTGMIIGCALALTTT